MVEVELLVQFNPLMNDHIRQVSENDGIHPHYMGKMIQKELIQILAESIKNTSLLT